MSDPFNWFGSYFELLEKFIAAHSTLAPLLLLLAEEAGVPIIIPGDGIIAYTGYRVTHNAPHTSIWLAFIVSLIAVLAGATILFFLARRYGQWIILKLGRFMFIRDDHIARAEKLFNRYGVWAVIFGRHIPGMRVPITILAASAGMTYRLFLFGTFVSTSLWILFYLYVGKRAGPTVSSLLHKSFWLTLLFVVAAASLVVGLHFYGRKRQRTI